MNRTFALLLASAVLLAHMLAIHVDAADGFAPPFEIAHVAFRLGRNFVLYGELAWDPGRPAPRRISPAKAAPLVVSTAQELPSASSCRTRSTIGRASSCSKMASASSSASASPSARARACS